MSKVDRNAAITKSGRSIKVGNSGIDVEGVRLAVGEMVGVEVGFMVGLCRGLPSVLK